jgi:hypothetical protein
MSFTSIYTWTFIDTYNTWTFIDTYNTWTFIDTYNTWTFIDTKNAWTFINDFVRPFFIIFRFAMLYKAARWNYKSLKADKERPLYSEPEIMFLTALKWANNLETMAVNAVLGLYTYGT